MTRLTRMLAVLMLLIGYQLTGGTPVRAEMLPACEFVCDESADCFEECEEPYESGWAFIICGEYQYGSAAGYCDHATWDTCNFLCDYGGDDETACLMSGEEATCGDYDIYLRNNDGYCSPEEYCDSSPDCGTCMPEMPTGLGTAIGGYMSGFEIKTACEVAAGEPYNYTSEWDCPPDEWITSPGSGPSCSVKNDKLERINKIRRFLHGFPAGNYYIDLAKAAIDVIYSEWMAEPCYLHPE